MLVTGDNSKKVGSGTHLERISEDFPLRSQPDKFGNVCLEMCLRNLVPGFDIRFAGSQQNQVAADVTRLERNHTF